MKKTSTKDPVSEQSGETKVETPTTSADTTPPPVVEVKTQKIPLTHLIPSPTNPRKRFAAAAQEELEGSMRAVGFSLSAMLVRPVSDKLRVSQAGAMWFVHWPKDNGDDPTIAVLAHEEEAREFAASACEIVAGERRYRAAKAVGIDEAPCIVRTMSDEEVLRNQLIENIQREDLTALEEARGFQQLLELRDVEGKPLHTVATLHKTTGKSIRHIERIVKLCIIEEDAALKEFREALDSGFVTAKHRLVVRVFDPERRAEFAKEILDPKYDTAPLSTAEAELLLQRDYMADTRNAGIDLDDETLMPEQFDAAGVRVCGGKCSSCPQLWLNAKTLVDAAQDDDPGRKRRKGENVTRAGVDTMCLKPDCFTAKKATEWARWKEANTDAAKRKTALSQVESGRIYQYGDQLYWNSGYVDLSQRPDHNDLKPGKEAPGTWRSMLKGQEFDIVVARDKVGRTHELVKHEVAIAGALANGHKELKSDKLTEPAQDAGDGSLPGMGPSGGGKLGALTPARKKQIEKANYEQALRVRLQPALCVALVEKAGTKPPAGFWLFVLRVWSNLYDTYDAVMELEERRGWEDGSADDHIAEMSDTQNFAVFVEMLFLQLVQDGPEQREMLKLFGVNVNQVEKSLRVVLDAELAETRAKQALRESMTWKGFVGELEEATAKEFQWNEGNVAINPAICVLKLPHKGSEAFITVARSEKGWHYGYEYKYGKTSGSSALGFKTDTAYGTHELALKTGILGARDFFKGEKAPAAVVDHLNALVKLIESETPAEEKPEKKGKRKK